MSRKKIDDETKEIIESFVSESYDLIEDAEKKVGFLETEANPEIVNTIFRLFHSIKGSAGYLNFENIKKVTHEAETLLDLFRKGKAKPSREDVDLLFQTVDFLRQMIVSVEKQLSDEGFEEPARLMVSSITRAMQNLKEEILEIGGESKEQVPGKKSAENLVTREMKDGFVLEAMGLLDKMEKNLLRAEKTKDLEILKDVYRDVHTIKGNAGFLGSSLVEKHAMDLESVLESLKDSKTEFNQRVNTLLLQHLDLIRKTLLLSDEDQGDGNHEPEYKPLGKILVQLGIVDEASIQNALDMQERPLGEILVTEGKISEESLEQALELQKQVNQKAAADAGSYQRKEIRVDTMKLDKLFDLVGELITSEAMVTNNIDLKGLDLPNFEKSSSRLNKITRELQEVTMMIRMIPMDGLFNKMNRLVRDLSRKFNKKIQFSASGEDTEMDRNVIEEISDPLVHILRNSIDHGIEEKSVRLAAGKSEEGHISLSARYEGNEIWIVIEDDGGGLKKEKILSKAVEKKIITPEQAGSMRDSEIWQLIFEPGFSTADQVSEVSGRGVGMDVVKKNLEKLRGKIDVFTQSGQGTKLILKIPMTMAIMDGITFTVSGKFYSFPSTDILEFIKVRQNMVVHTEKDREVINLRGEIIPVIRLHKIFNYQGDGQSLCEGIILVIKSGESKACCLIDDILGNQQLVVKPVSDYLGDVKMISGCSILGNGEVSLILDAGALMGECLEA